MQSKNNLFFFCFKNSSAHCLLWCNADSVYFLLLELGVCSFTDSSSSVHVLKFSCEFLPKQEYFFSLGRFAKMAPGGSARKQSDDEDGIHEERPSLHRASSVDEVSGQAPAIVATFLGECFRADGLAVPVELSENQKKVNKDVAHVIRDIGDRLTNDTSLNNLISKVQVSKDTAFDTFLQVAAQIFSDGVVNWGRIVTLFYFGYKLAVQVINEIPLIKMIIQWVVQFIKDRLAKWIFEQGGWVSLFD